MTSADPVLSDGLSPPKRACFLGGVFVISGALLLFQITQTRILSVITWYFLAFFAISVAMLGLTAGAVHVYLHRSRFGVDKLPLHLADASWACAVAMPISLLIQFSVVTTFTPTVTTVGAWAVLMAAMTVPYFYGGIVLALALTRSPVPTGLVYGVDLAGAAFGCLAVVFILSLVDSPSSVILAGAVSAAAAALFRASATGSPLNELKGRPLWRSPLMLTAVLSCAAALNAASPAGLHPILVKDRIEEGRAFRYERWNSYSRIVAHRPTNTRPFLYAPSKNIPPEFTTEWTYLNIDGEAGTTMYPFRGDVETFWFLKEDLVNLAYYLPEIKSAAVIGIGGGRDLLSAHVAGVPHIIGVEVNPIFVDLLMHEPYFSRFSGAGNIPGLELHVDNARSWFAATKRRFDLIQMSMIDTWAATGAGAFSLSENGLYTIEAWASFLEKLNDDGVFTVSRWYSPGDVNESGRMIALAAGTLLRMGVPDAAAHIYVARGEIVATMLISKRPLSAERLAILHAQTSRMGFVELVSPDRTPATALLGAIASAKSTAELQLVAGSTFLDLTPPTDNRPFFFNQLRFFDVPRALVRYVRGRLSLGVIRGNLFASMVLLLILGLASVAVVCTILVPLRDAARGLPRKLLVGGTLYFALIGMGFMLTEIALLQYFSVFLGHPVYALAVCLFSLILATGLGSLASARIPLNTAARLVTWVLVLASLILALQAGVPALISRFSADSLAIRIAVTVLSVTPPALLMGFAFPTGIQLVKAISPEPTPWFWGINGACGVLASVLAIALSMTFGIDVTMIVAAACYLATLPAAWQMLRQAPCEQRDTTQLALNDS